MEEENGAVREPEPEPTLDPDTAADPPVAEEAPLVSVAVTGQTVVVV